MTLFCAVDQRDAREQVGHDDDAVPLVEVTRRREVLDEPEVRAVE